MSVLKAGVLLIASGLAMNQALALEDGVVESCVVCHKGELDLSGKRVSDLTALMQAMIGGSVGHVVPLPELSAEDVRELAQALANGEAQ